MRKMVPLADGQMPALVSLAQAGRPGVLIVPSALGLDRCCEEQIRRFARADVFAVAPDVFWRIAPGPLPHAELGLAHERAGAANPRQLLRDLTASLRWLRDRGAGPLLALGVGFGGRFALLSAARGAVAGAVTWHSAGLDRLIDLAPQIRCPLSMHFASADAHIPMADIARLRNTFGRREGVAIHIHPDVRHGFTHPSFPGFSPVAANAAFADTVRLAERLAGEQAPPAAHHARQQHPR